MHVYAHVYNIHTHTWYTHARTRTHTHTDTHTRTCTHTRTHTQRLYRNSYFLVYIQLFLGLYPVVVYISRGSYQHYIYIYIYIYIQFVLVIYRWECIIFISSPTVSIFFLWRIQRRVSCGVRYFPRKNKCAIYIRISYSSMEIIYNRYDGQYRHIVPALSTEHM